MLVMRLPEGNMNITEKRENLLHENKEAGPEFHPKKNNFFFSHQNTG
jgi:hypothetical protein